MAKSLYLKIACVDKALKSNLRFSATTDGPPESALSYRVADAQILSSTLRTNYSWCQYENQATVNLLKLLL